MSPEAEAAVRRCVEIVRKAPAVRCGFTWDRRDDSAGTLQYAARLIVAEFFPGEEWRGAPKPAEPKQPDLFGGVA